MNLARIFTRQAATPSAAATGESGLTEPAAAGAARKLAYRSDIDGLRGIAVLLVIAFHFKLPPLSGGFIGVDIFFVISGFLITSLLCDEQDVLATLRNFYARRIRRLLPMFTFFAAATTAAVSLLLLPDDFLQYLRSLYFSLLFQANSFFDGETKDYFAPNAHELPLLHVWSLSIEWQFYLIFPVLFLVAQKWLPRRPLVAGLGLLTLALALFSWHQTGDSQKAYFLTSARFFELLAGCVTALVRVPLADARRHALVAVAVVCLCATAVLFDAKTAFPGAHALGVCLLAAIPALWGSDNPLLTSRGLVHTGRISYSAYLWHWPFVAFFTYLQIAITPWTGILLLAVVMGMAHFSYLWIEKPGRRIRLGLGMLVLVFVIAPIAVTMVFYRYAKSHDGIFQRLGDESTYIYGKVKPYLDNRALDCRHLKEKGTYECNFGARESAAGLYLIGDSHAGHYRWFAEVLATHAHLRAISLSHNECLILPKALQPERGPERNAQCAQALEDDYARIRQDRPRYVLIAQRWLGYPIDEIRKIEDAVAILLAQGITPVILGPVAEDGRNMKDCFYRHIKLRQSYAEDCSIVAGNPFEAVQAAKVTELFRALKQRYPAVILIDPRQVQCDAGKCKAAIDGVPIYEDTHHLNGYGSATLARQYIEKFGNPLVKPD